MQASNTIASATEVFNCMLKNPDAILAQNIKHKSFFTVHWGYYGVRLFVFYFMRKTVIK